MPDRTKYALVQHSGVTTGHAEFTHAVEQAAVTDAEAAQIEAAGGLVYDTYGDAEMACEETNYPPGVNGLVPAAKGTFSSTLKVNGLPVYITHQLFISTNGIDV